MFGSIKNCLYRFNIFFSPRFNLYRPVEYVAILGTRKTCMYYKTNRVNTEVLKSVHEKLRLI